MNEKRKDNSIWGIIGLGLVVLIAVSIFAVTFKSQKPDLTTMTASATVASPKATTQKEATKAQTKTTVNKSGSAPGKPEKTTAKKEAKTTKTTKAPTTKKKSSFNLGNDKSYDIRDETTKRYGGVGGYDNGATIGRDPTTKASATTKRYTTTTKKKRYDPYNAADYADPEDFYDDNYDDFFDYYDAEDYYYDHCDD